MSVDCVIAERYRLLLIIRKNKEYHQEESDSMTYDKWIYTYIRVNKYMNKCICAMLDVEGYTTYTLLSGNRVIIRPRWFAQIAQWFQLLQRHITSEI